MFQYVHAWPGTVKPMSMSDWATSAMTWWAPSSFPVTTIPPTLP